MRISYVNGVCVKNDAISNSILNEIDWFKSSKIYDIRLFAYECDYHDLNFTKVTNLEDIAFDPHFLSSDLIIFHFGVYYPLFNLLPICPKSAKRLVVFHNITPKQFVTPDNHSVIDKSFDQMSNIVFADHVLCVSEVNLHVLREAGISTPASVLPLAVQGGLQIPVSKPSRNDGLIRLAFIGRFVRSKGPQELLSAVEKVLERSDSVHLSLDMIGNVSFSDNTLLSEIKINSEQIMRRFGARIRIAIHGDASNEKKHSILRNADLFVLPTYHEGFCVPIVEALASGCRVVVYENSNTPFISGDLARLTPTGNVEDLSCALLDVIQEIITKDWVESGFCDYREKAQLYVQQFSLEQSGKRFTSFINCLMESSN